MNVTFQVPVCVALTDALTILSENSPALISSTVLLFVISRMWYRMEIGFKDIRHEMSQGFQKADQKTETEILKLRMEMSTEFQNVRGEIKDVRTEMNTEFQNVRSEIKDLRNEIKDVRNEIKEVRTEMTQGFKDVRNEIKQDFMKTDHRFEKDETRIEKLEQKDQQNPKSKSA